MFLILVIIPVNCLGGEGGWVGFAVRSSRFLDNDKIHNIGMFLIFG